MNSGSCYVKFYSMKPEYEFGTNLVLQNESLHTQQKSQDLLHYHQNFVGDMKHLQYLKINVIAYNCNVMHFHARYLMDTYKNIFNSKILSKFIQPFLIVQSHKGVKPLTASYECIFKYCFFS